MNIAICASEVFPYAKTGGLADVVGSLPKALVESGCHVKVFMPWYRDIAPQQEFAAYGYTRKDGVEFYFVRHDHYFHRDGLYGNHVGEYIDNIDRFVFLSNAVFSIMQDLRWSPDVLHVNDWQTAPAAIFLKVKHRKNPLFKKTKSIVTIHNIAFQGVFPRERFPALGISWDHFTVNGLEFYEQINLLKGGIVFADAVNTVSPTYAKQIQTKDYGCGLDGVLRQKRACVTGILNALDYSVWSPATDRFIEKRYSIKTLAAKAVNKSVFQEELRLSVEPRTPLLAWVGRLTDQKGSDILVQALPSILHHAQVVVLGTGDIQYHQAFRHLESKYRGRIRAILRFDEKVAHKVYAASDGFLMPSRFEPCGLSQMIAYAYASLPIAHATGGLVDTVLDVNHGGCGFMFGHYSSAGLVRCIERACQTYRHAQTWKLLMKQAMRQDYSWVKTAAAYMSVYANLVKKGRRA